MRLSLPLAALLTLFLTGCDEEKYDDDQYGDHCLVQQVSVSSGGLTTTLEYDQYDRVISMTPSGQGQNGRMEVTYNNDMAFFDFFVDNSPTYTAEATLNTNGNMVQVEVYDVTGMNAGDLQLTYNSEHQITSISGQDPHTGTNGTSVITWAGGNPVRFTTPDGLVECDFYTGERSSLNLGVGNVALLFQPFIANLAMMYSTDFIKTFDKNSVMGGGAVHFTYDKDSDDKVREMYWSTTSSGVFGTTVFNYECHTPH